MEEVQVEVNRHKAVAHDVKGVKEAIRNGEDEQWRMQVCTQ